MSRSDRRGHTKRHLQIQISPPARRERHFGCDGSCAHRAPFGTYQVTAAAPGFQNTLLNIRTTRQILMRIAWLNLGAINSVVTVELPPQKMNTGNLGYSSRQSTRKAAAALLRHQTASANVFNLQQRVTAFCL